MHKILIIDDEGDIRNLICGILGDEGYVTSGAASSDAAYASVESDMPDLVILDIWLQGSKHDGLEILAQLKAEHPDLPIIMISGHGTIETAVSAIKQGAYDFIEKPFKTDRLILMVKRALEAAALGRENKVLKSQSEDFGLDALVLAGVIAPENASLIRRIAKSESDVRLEIEDDGKARLVAAIIRRESDVEQQSSRIVSNQDFVSGGDVVMLPDPFGPNSFGAVREDTLGEDFLALALRDAREAFERYYLSAQVERFEGNVSKTAEFVGMERSALHRKIKSLEKSEVIDFDPEKAQSKAAK